MDELKDRVSQAVTARVPMNVVRARIVSGCFTGCVGEALPMHSPEEVASFLKYTPGVWGVGIRQPNGSNAIVAWFSGEVQL